MSWTYAEMPKKAKEYGGPEQYADHLYNVGKESGLDEGRSQGALLGSIGALGIVSIVKLISWAKEKRRKKEAAEYKEKLIKAMKERETTIPEHDHNDGSREKDDAK